MRTSSPPTRAEQMATLRQLAHELGAVGAQVTETADGLHIVPRPLSPATFHTYGDHRMVMAGAVLGLAVPGLVVEDPDTVAKTLPTFVELWSAMLGQPGVRERTA